MARPILRTEERAVAASTMKARINDSQSAYLHRSLAGLVRGFAGMALLLGVVGLYGVIAYSVNRLLTLA